MIRAALGLIGSVRDQSFQTTSVSLCRVGVPRWPIPDHSGAPAGVKTDGIAAERAFGADDVAGALYNRQRLRKLRFLMTDNIISLVSGKVLCVS